MSSPFNVSVTAAPISPTNESQHVVHVSIKTNEVSERTQSDIVAVVDVSGSMGTTATLKTATGTEAHGLSLLDLVVHSCKTIVSALTEKDRFGLVTYASNANVVVPLRYCTKDAVDEIITKLDALVPTSSTNIWAGLQSGLSLLENSGNPERMKSLLLLTDGQPTESPNGGEVAELVRYKDAHKSLSCTISTFGFGYGIRSDLLVGLSKRGGGMFSFIPDGSFVGTAFVNALTNLLVTTARDVNLTLETTGESKVNKVYGHPSLITTWGASVELFSLQSGQPKDVVFVLDTPGGKAALEKNTPFVTVGLKYVPDNTTKEVEVTVDAPLKLSTDEELAVQLFRSKLVEVITRDGGVDNKSAVTQLIKEIEDAKLTDKRAADILVDLTGQVVEALESPQAFSKWGVHYLPSLARSHLLQQCNNFKDPGIQHYGGKLFHDNRDLIDDIFIKLPAPKPKAKKYGYSSSSSSASSAPVSMSSYYCSANPCFAGECSVQMAGGATKMVKNIVKGDVVMTSVSSSAAVSCVVKTHCANGKTRLIELENGLLVTPYHPVRVQSNVWKFPCDMSETLVKDGERACEAVYSFVLEKDHVMVINGYEVVSLGHSFQEPVVAHAYFGSERVIADLKKMGSESGLIELEPGCLMRNDTGLVIGFNPSFVRQSKAIVNVESSCISCQATF